MAQVLVGFAFDSEDALSIVQAVVGVGAAHAQAEGVDFDAVGRVFKAFAVDAPLSRRTDHIFGADASVIDAVSLLALIAISCNYVVSEAVQLSSDTCSKAKVLPFPAASQRRHHLNALAVRIQAVVRKLAGKTRTV